MTCGDPRCKREWHRKKCAEWNRKNEDYFRANYLQKKLDGLADRGSPKVSSACRLRDYPGMRFKR